MLFSKRRHPAAALAAVVLWIAGCNGGGGDECTSGLMAGDLGTPGAANPACR